MSSVTDYWIELEAITRQAEDGRIDTIEFMARKKDLRLKYHICNARGQ